MWAGGWVGWRVGVRGQGEGKWGGGGSRSDGDGGRGGGMSWKSRR